MEGWKCFLTTKNGCDFFVSNKFACRKCMNISVNDFLKAITPLVGLHLLNSHVKRVFRWTSRGCWWTKQPSHRRLLSSTDVIFNLGEEPQEPKMQLWPPPGLKSCKGGIWWWRFLKQQFLFEFVSDSLRFLLNMIFVVVMLPECYWVVFNLFCDFRSI